ncbi:MAG TPA: PKD domain-containing protein [Mycobacteriales bacterium]|nr:PKD domain-containing protein [Mycobacteriales bacterium]
MRSNGAVAGLAALVLGAGGLAVPVFATGGAPSAPALFRVGAASVTINPRYPVYMGGYGGGPAGGTIARHVDPQTGRPENFTARAIAIVQGSRVVELARVDSQGWFAGYLEGPYGISDVRQAAAAYLSHHGAPAATEADIIVSTMHEHASPTIMGLWGPPAHALPYLRQVAAATTAALEQAYRNAQPATLWWGHANAPWIPTLNMANGNANEGWPNDGSILALWARNARTGATIATYVSEPGYPNIVNGPNDLVCPKGVTAALLSTDFPSYLSEDLERELGGLSLVASGTLGDQPGPMQTDTAISPDLPPVRVTGGKVCRQTIAFDDAMHMGTVLAGLVTEALGSARPVTVPVVAGAEQYVRTPIYNPELLAIQVAGDAANGGPWAQAGGDSLAYPFDRSTSPPYQVGNVIGTWVTGLRIGTLLILSEPGEFFPSVHDAWDRGISGSAGVFVVGMGQDQLGYDFPAYAYPFTYYSADENTFNPSLTLGDQVVLAGEHDAHTLGFAADYTANAETTATGNNYGAAVRPGVQFIPFPRAGDIDPATGSFAPLLEAFASPQRFGAFSVCNPPVAPSLPTCPLPPQPRMGPYHWTFGDGTSATTPPGNEHFFAHPFRTPGTHLVTVSSTDSAGTTARMSLPITVYPALSVAIQHAGAQDRAVVRGGSGHVLVVRWALPDGSSAYGASIPASETGPGPVTVTVTDSTGTMATARVVTVGANPAGNPRGAGSAGGPAAVPQAAAPYWVGAARADITPLHLAGVYLGGYGIGPVHLAAGVLRHIYVRVIAIRDARGHQVVLGALDLQGHFLAYSTGPYGFADIESWVQRHLGIPPAQVILQSTHTHNGPDDLGVWGGVPTSYLAYVAHQTESAIATAVHREQRASLSWATTDITGFSGTFGPNTDKSKTGDNADYPNDHTLRVLQAVSPRGAVVATVVNLSIHPTVYGPLNLVAPDWPGATATYLEHDEIGLSAHLRYGYPGSVAVVLTGAVGHSWPAGTPRGVDPALDPAKKTDKNYPADAFGNAIARVAMSALSAAQPVTTSRVAGASATLDVVNDNPVLAAAILAPIPGYHIDRSVTPPYMYGDVLQTVVRAIRIGNLAFTSAPGEEYPAIQATLSREIGADVVFPMSLAEDQLGYIEELGDYNGAMQCSSTDEGFFTISPTFGNDFESTQRTLARRLGFPVFDPGPLADANVGPLPPATACTIQQLPIPVPVPGPVPVPASPPSM